MMRAMGLMSGTSMDGVDAALIKTDGVEIGLKGSSLTMPYDKDLSKGLHELVTYMESDMDVERELTLFHAKVVEALLEKAELKKEDVGVIGFHGHTILHRPEKGVTIQIGDGALLAQLAGIDVVNDFRTADIRAGGQGAPLVPLYQMALLKGERKPVAILNVGGVANVTYIGKEDLIALDTGPGNALLDDWIQRHTELSYDVEGKIAAKGEVHQDTVDDFLSAPYFKQEPPKSLDRNTFGLKRIENFSLEDGAATLCAFTAQAVASQTGFLPSEPLAWYVTGGGRLNPTLMQHLEDALKGTVESVGVLNLDGDALEAQAFAYLAVRSLKKLPLSLPSTTGARSAVTGGVFYPALP